VNGSRNGITQLTFFIDLLGEEYGIPKVEWPPYVVSLTIGGRKDIVEHDYELMESIVARIGGRNLDVPQFPRGEWTDRMRVYAKASLHASVLLEDTLSPCSNYEVE